ncbi:MAG: ABC transporter permease [Bacteroidota bacterium]|nr:ABC transporter permease [Bacteroidota bacterium]
MKITAKAFRVARWEFVERVKTKSFLIGLFLTPVIMAVFILAPYLLNDTMAKKERGVIALYDGTGVLADSIESAFAREFTLPDGSPRYEIRRIPRSLTPAEAAERIEPDLLSESVEAAIIVPPAVFDSLSVEYRAKNTADIDAIVLMERTISDLVAARKLTQAGLDPMKVRELNRRTAMRTIRVSEEGEKESGFLESFGMSYVLLIILMMMVLGSGGMLVRSMVEEKSNRIVEILVSSCSPLDLMFGKIMGLSLLGFVQVGFFALIGVVLVVATGVTGLPLENIWLMAVYFVLGFLFYAALFVALGCLSSTEQEAQQITGYLTLFLALPLALSMIAVRNPQSSILVVLSFIPFLTTPIMLLRLPGMTPPLWEIVATLGVFVVSIAGMVWAAAKIFAIGILLTGKRPRMAEVLRWLKE